MINLIKIELIKQFKSKSFIVMMSFVILFTIAYIFILNNQYNYISNIISRCKMIMEMSSNIIIFSSIIISIISSGILSDEINKKSIKELITKPHKRSKILTSKYICMLIIVMIIFFAVLFSSVATIILLFKDIKFVLSYEYLKLYILNIIPLLFTGSFCMFLSVIFKNSKLISGFSILLSLTGVVIFQLLLKIDINFIQYTFLPYLDFSIYKDIEIIKAINIEYGVSLSELNGIIYLMLYSIAFYILSIFIFNKKDIC